MQNYRPINNLNFISKIVEKVVIKQVMQHVDTCYPLPDYQSAYRPNYSTETLLLKFQADILSRMDKQEVSMVVLIDLSAAFDTIDHNIMLNVLQSEFHITGNVLNWFSTYLTHRSQQVKVNEHISEPLFTDIGCPQGSCLGPICFTLYVTCKYT